jgi:DNA-binding MarR family transcriptional regulator
MPTETQILDLVRSNPGLRGSEIATRLEADTPQVSAVLWKLRDQASSSRIGAIDGL